MLETIVAERRQKIDQLRASGISPYPSKAKRTAYCKDISEKYDQFEGKEVTVAGRILAWRDIGKLIFASLIDFSGRVQLFIRVADITDFDLKLVDIGDFVSATGIVIKTRTGEISVEVKEFTIVSKSLRPLPEKWSGIQDVEVRLRKRYLDMTMNPEVRDIFVKKGNFWRAMRDYMLRNDFVEVRTPVLEHTTGGADANPFETYHKALDTKFYLRISLELPLKKAIGAGFDKVFEIGPVFRNEGIDDEHLQDYDMMEFYWAYENYETAMPFVQEMYRYIAKEVFGKTEFVRNGMTFDLAKDWEKIDYVGVIKKHFDIDVLTASHDDVKNKLDSLHVKFDPSRTKHRLVDLLFKQIRKDIAGPAFLINQPKFVSPLAKSKSDNPELTERYQILIAGSEMGNGYSELNDPEDQLNRFLEQQKMRDSGDDEAQMLDYDFIEMLEYGMPPVTGFGVSERLFSYMMDMPIRMTTMFPQMKKEERES